MSTGPFVEAQISSGCDADAAGVDQGSEHGEWPNCRQVPRPCDRSQGQPSGPHLCSEHREVQGQSQDGVAGVPRGQAVHSMDSLSHQQQEPLRDEAVQDLHLICGQEQDGPDQHGEEPAKRHSDARGTNVDDSSKGQEEEQEEQRKDARDRDGVGDNSHGRSHQRGSHSSLGTSRSESHRPRRDPQAEDDSSCISATPGHCNDGREFDELENGHVMSKKVRKQLTKNVQFLHARDTNAGGEVCDKCAVDVCTVDLRFHGVDVSEVFSVPRICPEASKKGLKSGKSYDIRGGWNFLEAEHRKRCLQELDEMEPEHLHVCPPCGPYSPLLRLSKGKRSAEEIKWKRVETNVLLEFAIQLCRMQEEKGRKYNFEYPTGAEELGETTCVVDFVEIHKPKLFDMD